MDILMDVTAPPALVRLAEIKCEGIETIKTVKFVVYDLPNDEIGMFDPNQDLITIDLGNCFLNRQWMKKGVLYVPNIWFNMLYALFHERAHARQKLELPEQLLMGLEYMDTVLESTAHKEAMESIFDWVDVGGSIPDLLGLGWAGVQISKMLNALYASRNEEVSEELDALRFGVVANIEALPSSIFKGYADENKNVLRQSVDKGDVGKLIETRRYLTAEEFFSL